MGESIMQKTEKSHWEPRYASREKRMQASEIRDLLKLLDKPGVVSFAGGIPDPELFPRDAIETYYQRILSDPANAKQALQYSVSEGDSNLRQWIVSHMATKGVISDADNILITSGSQQALEFIGRLFISPNDTALVTAPTYLGALQAFSANKPVYDELKVENTNRTAAFYQQAAQDADGDLKLAYVVPNFANPSGETLSREGRVNLLGLAQDLDIPVIEDSPYAALPYDGQDVITLQALNIESCGSIDASRVIHCGSFSKVFTPGLRIGWVCASHEIISRITIIKQGSDLNSPAINQAVMHLLASELFDTQVAKAIASYRIKRDVMLAALAEHMPEGVTWSRPDGGLFIWATLPESINAQALLPKAVEQAGIAYVPGHAFHADGSGKNTMRLSFSLPRVEDITSGIEQLAHLIKGEIKDKS